jgi:hypothetical protein
MSTIWKIINTIANAWEGVAAIMREASHDEVSKAVCEHARVGERARFTKIIHRVLDSKQGGPLSNAVAIEDKQNSFTMGSVRR